MTEPRRDHYLPPTIDDDTEIVLDQAIDNLGDARGLPWLGVAATRLHLLTSLMAETERLLPRVVADARDQKCSWAEIGDLLGVTRASAQQRYGPSRTGEHRRLSQPPTSPPGRHRSPSREHIPSGFGSRPPH